MTSKENTWISKLIEKGVPELTARMFLDYHQQNLHIWEAFEKLTLRVIAKKKVVGAKAIVERIRWDEEIEYDREFKVSNSYTAYYARVFEIKYPQHSGFFKMKPIQGLLSEVNHE